MTRTDQIRPGGLFRCCVETIQRRKRPGREGEVQACTVGKGCGGEMIFTDRAWKWNRPL